MDKIDTALTHVGNINGDKSLFVIKIGGNVIDNSENLHRFLKDFTALKGFKILVHGGGIINNIPAYFYNKQAFIAINVTNMS